MNTSEAKNPVGRPPKEKRRRKKNSAEMVGRRLGVNLSSLDLKRFAYRWMNDVPARIFAKTKEDDWDIVANDGSVVTENADIGNAVSQIVGTNADGSPMRAYLTRKPLNFWEDDQKDKQTELDNQLAEMRKGNARDGSAQSDYVPNTGINL